MLSRAGDRIRTGDVQLGKPHEAAPNLITHQVDTARPLPACTSACTGEGQSEQPDPVMVLAAKLAKLSPEERARLAAMLTGQSVT